MYVSFLVPLFFLIQVASPVRRPFFSLVTQLGKSLICFSHRALAGLSLGFFFPIGLSLGLHMAHFSHKAGIGVSQGFFFFHTGLL